ncbi:hypothetical protein H4219_003617 [Mycoemilia scoparia]|uniref:Major facilitator superfamily (MFS) profile domain-containing protein n=1 Tax=Mycoemilia scoparia TaxID=417184 RepID=A0A9W8DT43_9FUNG|nr:hypothetical protein H4219_003617 [Mycoemilia scoparia]
MSHIQDNKVALEDHVPTHDETVARRNALEAIDNAKFSWFHVKTIIVAGIGFYTDQYDLFAINIAMYMMGFVYYADAEGSAKNTTPRTIDTLVKASAQIGTMFGQLVFGYLGDRLGRKRVYGIELIIIIVCTIGCAFSGSAMRGLSVYWFLFIWRFFLGFGIGGDYPASSTIVSEFANSKNRGAMIATIFSFQGLGIVSASLVAMVVLACFKGAIDNDQLMLDYCWRIVVGVGVIPGVAALYFRLTIPETPRYTLDIDNDITKASSDVNKVLKKNPGSLEKQEVLTTVDGKPVKAVAVRKELPKPSWKEFKRHFGQWKHFKVLMGTSVTWFALDVAFYGLNLNTSIILSAIGFGGDPKKDTIWRLVFLNAVGNIILNCLGTLPGYIATIFTVDRLGRRFIQFMGFTMLVILFIILGFAYHQILDRSIAGFIVLFTLAQFFLNFGPNSTTFIVPAEVFPTRWRSTGHGISAAMGKLGAIISQVGFFQLKDRGGKNAFIPQLIQIFALFMFIGLVFTWFIPETKGKTLEELSGEFDDDYTPEQTPLEDYQATPEYVQQAARA